MLPPVEVCVNRFDSLVFRKSVVVPNRPLRAD